LEFLLIGVLGAGAIYYWMTRPSMGVSQMQATTNQLRSSGPVPGTVPPGVQTPGQGVSGQGPNTTAALVSTGSGVGLGLAGMAATTAGITTLGAATLGIGAIIGVGLVLWQGHLARAKGAKDENAALNVLVPGFQGSVQAEFDALNGGQVSPTTALQDLEAIRVSYWAAIAPYQKGAGQHTHPCTPNPAGRCDRGDGYGATKCDKTCTAGCCVGCGAIEPIICNAKSIIMAGGGSFKTPVIGGSKYGYSGSPSYVLSYKAS
jgi:hypothetical protein